MAVAMVSMQYVTNALVKHKDAGLEFLITGPEEAFMNKMLTFMFVYFF